MKKMNNKGFSLVELIVVVAIMAVLMAVLVPTLIRNVEKTRVQKDKSAISEIHHAIELAISDEEFRDALPNAEGVEAANDAITVADLFANAENSEDGEELAAEVALTVGNTVGLTSTAMTDYCKVTIRVLDTTAGRCIMDVEYGNADSGNDDYVAFHIDSTGENDGTFVADDDDEE